MFRIRDMCYDAGEIHARHAHDEVQISVILRGAMSEQVNGVHYRGSAGDVVVKPAGVPHSDHFEATRIVCLDADPGELDLPRAYAWHRAAPATLAAVRLAKRFLSGLDVSDDVDELIAALPAPPIRDRAVAARAAQAIDETWRGSVSIDAIASDLGVHRVYLARVFRAQWGCSPREYLNHVRVRAAAHRLSSTAHPLAHIALDAGFSDQSHMTRVFARGMGMTPAAFRRMTRN